MPVGFLSPPYQYTPPYTDYQRMVFRQLMGYSQLFSSSNAIFEGILDTIESVPAYDDGATFNQTCVLMVQVMNIDQLRLNNFNLGFATKSSTKTEVDAVRNDAFLKASGRTLIKQLSQLISMKPARDYYRADAPDLSGNIYPASYQL